MKLGVLGRVLLGASVGALGFVAPVYKNTQVEIATLSVYPGFSALDIGTPATDRTVYFAVWGNASGNQLLSSVSVNGGAQVPTRVVGEANATNRILELWRVNVPEGLTCSIVPTFDGPLIRCGITWYVGYGATSVTGSDSGVTKRTATSTSAQIDNALTITAAGIAFAINTASTEAVTWAPGGGVENVDTNSTTGLRYSAYSTTVPGATQFSATAGPTTGAWRIAAASIA